MTRQSRNKCDWPGCESEGYNHIGEFGSFCPEHERMVLQREILLGIPGLTFDGNGKPSNHRWLNWFARFASNRLQGQEGLSKAKIEQRAHSFAVHETVVEFTIERHPVGFVNEQRWSYDVEKDKWKLVEEKTVNSDYEFDEASGYYRCPRCGSSLQTTPGTVRCESCSFTDLHDHSW